MFEAWNLPPAEPQSPLSAVMQGSGLSDGEWVTLGAREVDDVGVAVGHLRSTGLTSAIGLWGRSMGAVTALLYAHRDPSMAGVVRPPPPPPFPRHAAVRLMLLRCAPSLCQRRRLREKTRDETRREAGQAHTPRKLS